MIWYSGAGDRILTFSKTQ